MYQYTLRVRLSNGTIADIQMQAPSFGAALAIVETQYGPGSYMGLIDETNLNVAKWW